MTVRERGAAEADPATAVRAFAPAKINLSLAIVGRRADGYHELDSLVAFADVGDTVTVTPAPADAVIVDGPMAGGLDGEAPNALSVAKARELLRAASPGRAPPVRITLTKRLPVASGIGGGSSDAAATLRALNALWGLNLSRDDLASRALALGADAPVCVHASAARMSGIGEVIQPIADWPPLFAVLVNPGVGVSTPKVFRAYAESGVPFATSIAWPSRWDAAGVHDFLTMARNDLEEPATVLCPQIGAASAALAAQAGCIAARMSGSGATVWGVFARESEATAGARAIAATQSAWWVQRVRLRNGLASA